MMPDVNSYGLASRPSLARRAAAPAAGSFAISDRAASQESPLLQSFLSPCSGCRTPASGRGAARHSRGAAVLRRFELDDDEFNQLRRWVQETGIRWGWTTATRSASDLPRLSGNSWLFGLRRMLLGFAMGTASPVADPALCGTSRVSRLALGKARLVCRLPWREFLPRLQQAQLLPEWNACLSRCWIASIWPTRTRSASSSSSAAS